ncbi:hypothetical protein MED222_05875 [Vibrio sp. MED222]|nr:hypothetical protein MED222_05875 [Vibrio sp. MED222]
MDFHTYNDVNSRVDKFELSELGNKKNCKLRIMIA